MTIRIDRSQLPEAKAFALDDACDVSAERRARNKADQRCINDTRKGTHGLATHGCRCYRCHLVHKHGSVVARSMPEYKAARPVFELTEVAA